MAKRRFHWAIDDCVMHETDETGATTVTYTNEPGPFGPLISENRGGTTSYHHYDALGSTIALTNDAGTVTDTFFFDAWGSKKPWRTGTTPTPYTWCGRWGYQDDTATTGQYYVRARSYGPTIARWTSVDPAFSTSNLFTYASLSPTSHTDPSGLIEPVTCGIVIVCGVVIIVSAAGCSGGPKPPAPLPGPGLPAECKDIIPKINANDPNVKKAADELANCISQSGRELRKLAKCIMKIPRELSCDVAAPLLACMMVPGDPCNLDQKVWNNCQSCCDRKAFEKAAKDMCHRNIPSAIRFSNMQKACYIADCGREMG